MKAGYTLDREKNNNNYEPGNVRWASTHVQRANRGVSKNNSSGYTGVKKDPRCEMWIAYVGSGDSYVRIAYVRNKIDAVSARNKYILENELWEYPIQKWKG